VGRTSIDAQALNLWDEDGFSYCGIITNIWDFKMITVKIVVAWFFLCLSFPWQVFGQETPLADDVVARLADALSSRRVDNSAIQRRGLADVYAKALKAVPFVISANGSGSSVVVGSNSAESSVLVITNNHVVDHPFVNDKRQAFVLTLFYEPALINEAFSRERIRNCQRTRDSTGWCKAFRQSVRPAFILGTDVSKDLALLLVPNAPRDIAQLAAGQIDGVRAGDEVTVVGHPLELLWSLTTGIVSAVRREFPTGTPPRVTRSTVIQTQTPINPGNSGGPLMNQDGKLIGVVFAQSVTGRVQTASQDGDPRGSEVSIPASGLNFAIGVNEVQAFVSELTTKNRR